MKSLLNIALFIVLVFVTFNLGLLLGTLFITVYYCLKGKVENIKSAWHAYAWYTKHPIKTLKVMGDDVVVYYMRLEDKVFKKILERKYNGYQKRIKRIQYENENNRESMEQLLQTLSRVIKGNKKELELAPANIYTPHKVIYEDYNEIWGIEK